MTAYTQLSWQMMPPLSLSKTLLYERQKSSLIFVSLAIYTRVQTQCTLTHARTHSGTVLHQNIREWSVSPSIKYVIRISWNTSRLYSPPHCVSLHMSPVLGTFTLFSFTHTSTQTLDYGWTLWHCDDVFVTSLHLYKVMLLKACPSLWHLEFTFCHLTFAERLMTALSTDVSLLLTLNPDSPDTGTDNTGGLEMVPHRGSAFRSKWAVLL